MYHGDTSQLAYIRAASAGYPLRGTLKVADQPFAAGAASHALPERGACWPDSRLAAALGVGVADLSGKLLTEHHEAFELTAELPGLDEKDVEVRVAHGVLTT